MTEIKTEYKVHPKYDLYECSKDGTFKHINSNLILNGNVKNQNLLFIVKSKTGKQNTISLPNLIWTCFNGEIQEHQKIDHINDNKTDNRLENLQLMTHKQNIKKRKIDNKKITKGNAYANKRLIKAIVNGSDEFYFKSQNQAGKYFGINPATVYHHISGTIKNETIAHKGLIKFSQIDELPTDKQYTIIPDGRLGKKKISKVVIE